ncbi:MAG: hypothetical protein L7U52_04030 [Alphaproteobacteria bacterium]|nr:hypothetical protein [Alphaproteobacteria bacterium]
MIVGTFSIAAFAPAYAQEEEGAYGYEHCENPTSMKSGGVPGDENTGQECIVSCRKIANLIADTSNSITLSSAFEVHDSGTTRGFGECTGAATDIRRTIYKIELAKDDEGIDDTRCTVWEGEMPVSFLGKSSGDVISSNRPIDVSACPAGTYDTMLITQSRFISYSGETVFPHDPSAVVRTHSTGVDTVEEVVTNSSSPTSMVEMHDIWDSWVHGTIVEPGDGGFTNWGDPVMPVLEIYNGNTEGSLAFVDTRKFALESVAADAMPSGASYIDFDELVFFSGNAQGSTRPGYYCEHDYMCARALPGDVAKMEWLIKEGEEGIGGGLPVSISEATDLNIEIGYFAPRSGEEELGLYYVFYHASTPGVTAAVGARPGEDGLFITVSTEQESDTSN